MIKLANGLEYDETKPFSEQADEVKSYLVVFFWANEPVAREGALRVNSSIYDVDGIRIEIVFLYKYPEAHAENGLFVDEVDFFRLNFLN